jgi:hypothetical protein
LLYIIHNQTYSDYLGQVRANARCTYSKDGNHTTEKGAPLQKSDNDHAISWKDLECGPESLRAEKKASDDICYEDLVPDGTRNILSIIEPTATISTKYIMISYKIVYKQILYFGIPGVSGLCSITSFPSSLHLCCSPLPSVFSPLYLPVSFVFIIFYIHHGQVADQSHCDLS